MSGGGPAGLAFACAAAIGGSPGAGKFPPLPVEQPAIATARIPVAMLIRRQCAFTVSLILFALRRTESALLRRNLDLIELFAFKLHHLRGQRRVVERGCVLLARMYRPVEEALYLLAGLALRLLLINQQVGKRGNRIRILSGRIRDRDAEVRRHVGRRSRRRRGHSVEARLHPLAVVI